MFGCVCQLFGTLKGRAVFDCHLLSLRFQSALDQRMVGNFFRHENCPNSEELMGLCLWQFWKIYIFP